jgi:hypothetical protein
MSCLDGEQQHTTASHRGTYLEEGRNNPLMNAIQYHLLQISAPTKDSTQLLTRYKQHVLQTLQKQNN